MDKKRLKLNINRKNVDWITLTILGILIFPYLFFIGEYAFDFLGKYYYAITGVIALTLFLIFKLPKLLKNIKNVRNINGRTKALLVLVAIFVLYLFIILLFNNISLDDYLFANLLMVFLFVFCFSDFNEDTLKVLSILSLACITYLTFKNFIFGRSLFFNPNTYSYLFTILTICFSCYFYINPSKNGIRLVVLVFLISLVNDLVIYESDAQIVALGLLGLLLIHSKKIIENKKLYVAITLGLFVIVASFGFIVNFLIRNDILIDETFISYRGQIFMQAVEVLCSYSVTLVKCYPFTGLYGEFYEAVATSPHNGFLDACFRLTPLGACIFLIIFAFIVIASLKNFKKDKTSIFLYFSAITLILLNTVESFMLGLNDAYFVLIILGALVSRLFLGKNNPSLQDGIYKTQETDTQTTTETPIDTPTETSLETDIKEDKELSGENVDV